MSSEASRTAINIREEWKKAKEASDVLIPIVKGLDGEFKRPWRDSVILEHETM